MNYGKILVAGGAATVAYYVYGFLVQGLLIAKHYAPYPSVYRSGAVVLGYMPLGFVGSFFAITAMTILYARGYNGTGGAAEGATFGLLIGILVACGCVGENYVTLNIGGRLALEQALAALFQWTVVGIVISLIYKPVAAALR